MLSLPPHQMLFSRLLADLDMLESHKEAFAVQIAQCEAVAALAGQNHPSVVLPHIKLWKAQYLELRHRYSFVDLEGPRRVGSLCTPATSDARAGTEAYCILHHKCNMYWLGYVFLHSLWNSEPTALFMRCCV